MKRILLIFACLIPFSLGFGYDWEEVLKQSERYREFSKEGFSFDYQLKEEGKSPQLLRVYIKPNDPGIVLVKFLSPANLAKRRILTTSDGIWMYDTGMRTPIRISDSQLLFGQASTGDISRIVFNLYYYPVSGSVEDSQIKLTLSKREGQKVSYPKVILYLDKETYKPLKAEFFSSSGVKMKTVVYEEYGEFDGKVLLKKFRVKNEISGDETTIELSNYSANRLPLSMFSKSALERIP